MGFWSDLWKKRAEDWIYAYLETGKVPPDAQQGDITPESAYVSVFLKSARIIDVRKGFKKFYGTVHSFIRLQHRSKGDAEFNVVTTPAALKDVDASGIDRVIQLNHRLLGPVPYVGGDLEMEVGLFSIASSDMTAPYLALLEKLSAKAGVSYVNMALPFAGLIVEGVNLLAGSASSSILEVGIAQTQVPPKRGYFVVIRAPKDGLDVKNLAVDPADFRLLGPAAKPLVDNPYMVIEVRSEDRRDDWSKIPEVAAAYRAVQEEYRQGRVKGTEEALLAFRRLVLTCNDLLPQDAIRLADKVKSTYQDSGPPTPVTRAKGGRKQLPDLNKINLYGS